MSRFLMGLVGDNLAVGDAACGEISVLNPSAAVVWLTLTQGPASQSDLSELFEGALGDQAETAEAAVGEILRRFEAIGWARQRADGAWQAIHAYEGEQTSGPLWTPTGQRPSKVTGLQWSRQIKLSRAPVYIDVRTEADVDRGDEFSRMAGFFGGLPRDGADRDAARLTMLFAPDCIEVADCDRTAAFHAIDAATGVFLKLAIGYAYPDARAFTTLHAGAVCKPGGAILLPAITGSGKTTLTAYLIANGWRYGGDDVVGIARFNERDAIQVLPFPTALGVKDGSVDILRPHFPALNDAKVITYGSKSVRYISCEHKVAPMGGDWRTVRALVFPSYEKGARLQLDALSACEALRNILEAGWGDGGELDPPGFDLLLEAVNDIPAYSLRYSSLDAAAAALDGLI